MTFESEAYEPECYDEREAAEIRALEEALYGDPWKCADYDPDSDDVEYE